MRVNRSKCTLITMHFILLALIWFIVDVGVTTECLMIMSGRYKPRFLANRSDRAVRAYLRRFRLRHKLSIRRITHIGTKHRADLEVYLFVFVLFLYPKFKVYAVSSSPIWSYYEAFNRILWGCFKYAWLLKIRMRLQYGPDIDIYRYEPERNNHISRRAQRGRRAR